jgi:predicted metal-dependent phosphoesterase TrpH
MLADLHMHSTVSDGWCDPEEVAEIAAAHGIELMALSDHDSFYGVERARQVALSRGLGYLVAVEVTTYPGPQMRHILGHGVDAANRQLLSVLERNQQMLRRQTVAWVEHLEERGIARELHLRRVERKPTPMPGAVLKLILEQGLMTEREAWASVKQAVDDLPADVYSVMPSPKEAVDAIHAAGGLATLAHPGSIPDQDLMREVLPLIDALEVYTRRHKPDQIPVYEEIARRHGLPMSVGSDFHAFNREPYEVPRRQLDPRYLDRLFAKVSWPPDYSFPDLARVV